jgi:hypothetical protein
MVDRGFLATGIRIADLDRTVSPLDMIASLIIPAAQARDR